ncbi:MAG TPA: ATP-dependent Clp protease adaptor ClpS [Pirellulales bacterium]|jgi:ATP-dependent Clp protease adaptor protein ClpS|nr:ATP-dependent Clp protease adaptor ClpS [Pirellulales bacterium]
MSDKSQAAVAEPVEVEPARTVEERPSEKTRTKAKRQPPYHVILWDDQDHSHAYVIVMLQQLFGYPPTKGFQLADEVDRRGRAIVATTTLERAELKRDQIRAFGKDILNGECPGSMYATIEPAP